MGQIEQLTLTQGSEVSYQGCNYSIKRILDLQCVLLESNDSRKEIIRAFIKDLKPPTAEQQKEAEKTIDVQLLDEDDWKVAQSRFAVIKPILENKSSTDEIKAIAAANKVHISTLYRWINRYNQTQQLSSLVPEEKSGGRGIGRLSSELEVIITSAIEDHYLTKQKKSIQKVCNEVALQCHNANILPPSPATVRRRIEALSDEFKMRHRYGKEVTRNIYEPLRGEYDHAKAPLDVVQIDHTLLDIILVDEVYRRPLLRPWITLAFDVFSRMIVGFYISFDPPGALGTGMCLANAILPKEMWLAKLDIQGEWPCWGVMKTIHADNAKEFRGNMLKRVAEEYGINLEWREVKRPEWGGHIERCLGTLLKEIQTLPGTTFSNIKERKTYNSEAKATLTLSELEKWLTIFIINVYHKRFHSGIGTSPLAKFNEGIFGSGTQKGIGIPKRIFNERKVRLDFMPFVERSIQEYGVQIDHIHYYDDKLRPYINTLEPNQKKSKQRRKFIFKRDPRDISVIYFYDPELYQYFEIPYRDTSHPPITLWEYRAVERWLNEQGRNQIDERAIFDGYAQMKDIESKAIEKTRKVRRSKKDSKRQHSLAKSLRSELAANEKIKTQDQTHVIIPTTIKPFEDIDL